APDTCNSLSEADAARLLRDGFLDSPSSRTGQTLRIGRAFLQEQLDDPDGHDVLEFVTRVKCPLLIIHGENDATVPLSAARRLAEAAGNKAQLHLLPGGDHVFNTPNPLPEQARSSEQLDVLV